jgi:hypothetical protein
VPFASQDHGLVVLDPAAACSAALRSVSKRRRFISASASRDGSDPIAVAKWLGALRVDIADADAIARDMLRPPRERELGPATHRERYEEAHASILRALDYAGAPEPGEGEPGDPAGSSGAGSVR